MIHANFLVIYFIYSSIGLCTSSNILVKLYDLSSVEPMDTARKIKNDPLSRIIYRPTSIHPFQWQHATQWATLNCFNQTTVHAQTRATSLFLRLWIIYFRTNFISANAKTAQRSSSVGPASIQPVARPFWEPVWFPRKHETQTQCRHKK